MKPTVVTPLHVVVVIVGVTNRRSRNSSVKKKKKKKLLELVASADKTQKTQRFGLVSISGGPRVAVAGILAAATIAGEGGSPLLSPVLLCR